ncbi:MAG: hypothetical protein K6G65_06015 [Lachnospiraceae bacterium]|nr:hypothetical protein [Lachnospiraceae bacterium]
MDNELQIYARKYTVGYIFWGEEEIRLHNYNYREKICKKCGNICAEEKTKILRYNDFFVEGEVCFEKSPVIFSKQYFNGNQVAIISPKLYKVIKDKVEDAVFTPVFKGA